MRVCSIFICSDCTDALKTSLAAALRHSAEQAQRTYDRRTANTKKQLAVNLARQYAESELEQPECRSDADETAVPVKEWPFKPGDFVACLEEGSTLTSPKINLGQIHSFSKDATEASLLWYKQISPNLYKLHLEGQQWTERCKQLTGVSVKAAKNRPGVLRLQTSARKVHKELVAD